MAEQSRVPAPAEKAIPRPRDPWEMLEGMQREMLRLWDEAWPFGRRLRRPDLSATWSPRVDMFEQNGAIVVKAELPGVKKEDLEVTVDEGELVIRGERRQESEVKEEDYYRMERSYGSLYRRLPLPEGVTPEQVQAVYKDGVLEVRIPKPAQKAPEARKVPIG